MKNKIIDIDADFEGLEFDEAAIVRHTGYVKSAITHTGQKRSQSARSAMSDAQKGRAKDEETKEKISDSLRGKTLEQLLGPERAQEGRLARSHAHKGKKRDPEVGQKIAATRRANGSYDVGGMAGKQHKEETKIKQSTKAQIRQDIKRELGLGRSDSIPKDVLERAYKRAGLL